MAISLTATQTPTGLPLVSMRRKKKKRSNILFFCAILPIDKFAEMWYNKSERLLGAGSRTNVMARIPKSRSIWKIFDTSSSLPAFSIFS
jgi:hypothetical protein